MKMNTLQDLFLEQLRHMYDAERQLVKALPKMAKNANAEELRTAIEQHLEETKHQVERLEQVFGIVEERVRGKTCEAMKGLVEEGQEIMELNAEPEVADAGLICAAQKVEHYEIASYGCLSTWAQQLGLHDADRLLRENLEEEKHADAKLTEIAERQVNALAAAHA